MASVMGVTQRQIEEDYYLIDLAAYAEKSRNRKAARKLDLLTIINARNLEQKEYRELIRTWTREAGIKPKTEKFNRSKFEELRALS
ncbi:MULTISPECIES: hypothetical protein [Bacillus]|nr:MULTISPECIES: hypothetical protein [Bacillus]MCX2704704.1 hypothetical protein [Bacillus sp. AS_5]KAB7674984.1 hypothetical protein GBN91_28320 [Bacillus sp. B1-WWTP-T-0.5-Post-4]PEF92038.1 hypothetical protein CON46_15830 [Bacillus cereus]PFQ20938.1 hypothetical protein COK16_27580 [Bacillus cereus]PGM74668.1 hypothetical protein CN952_07110 [Bacillus cereus]